MAVFDKASLVMIPSQYKEGKIYNIKPENQSSSFEFERGSAATRVNSDGLIEQTGVSSTQLWNDDSIYLNGTASYNNGIVTFTASVNNDYILFQNLEGVEQSNYYEISFDTVVNSGSFSLLQGTGSSFVPNYLINETGSYKRIVQYTHATPYQILFWSSNSSYLGAQFDGTISNISIKKVNIDTPRLDYSGTEPALLLEPQRTNLLDNSEYDSGSGWLKSATTTIVKDSQIKDPFGGYNSYRFTTQNLYDNIIKQVVRTVTGDHTATIFIKGVNGVASSGSFVMSRGVGFDIDSSGVITTKNPTGYSAATSYHLEYISNGWYKVGFTYSYPSPGSDGFIIASDTAISDFYVYGGQVEVGSYATSYIPTNGQTETRLADVCTGGGDASVFNDSEGVLYAEVSRLNGDLSATTIAINKGGSEFSGFSFRTDGKIWAATYNGTSYENISQYTPTDFYDTYKICYKYKSNDFALWVNGVEVDSSVVNTLTLTGLNNLSFSSGTATNKFLGNVKALHYFNEALTDTELQQLTTI